MGPHGQGVYLDFKDAIQRLGLETVREKYGNLFEIYQRITGENAYLVPMRIYPAPHYTMGGLWVDYHLMTTISGLFAGGEANFSDHGANRLGASALMQGLADGYFVLPATIPDFIAEVGLDRLDVSHPEFTAAKAEAKQRIEALVAINGKRSPDSFQNELGKLLWDDCGMARSDPACAKRWRESPSCARSSGATSASSVARKRRTRRWRRPSGFPTFSSSPSSCASMRCTAPNPAAATSASRVRRPKARRSETTRTSVTPPRGNGEAQIGRPSCTRSH
ncbi:MAG: putative reductase flavoprotein subunit [bacterium]|nr:putative reductase flavoprotein subunit [bacterium]